MKKVIYFIVCSIAVLAVTSCGPNLSTKEISVTGADGTVYNSYQTACSKGDFDAARDYIGKMKERLVSIESVGSEAKDNKSSYSKLVQEAEDYVFNEEIQLLASLNEEQANNRIIMIINQRSIEGYEAQENACLGKEIEKEVLNIGNLEGMDGDTEFLEEYVAAHIPQEVKSFREYISWCSNHNTRCGNILISLSHVAIRI